MQWDQGYSQVEGGREDRSQQYRHRRGVIGYLPVPVTRWHWRKYNWLGREALSVYSWRGDLGKDGEGKEKAEWEWKQIRTKNLWLMMIVTSEWNIWSARKWRAHAQLNHRLQMGTIITVHPPLQASSFFNSNAFTDWRGIDSRQDQSQSHKATARNETSF